MKRTTGPARPVTASVPAGTHTPPDVFGRLRLELLDEYTCEKRGYDPYDTASNRAVPDIWVDRRKRA